MKKILLAIVLVGAIIVAIVAIKGLQFKTLKGMSAMFRPPPDTISTAVVTAEKWQDTLPAIGTVSAVQGVQVSTEISGIVREIAFHSGETVTNGEPLVQLDASSEEAQLRALDAQAELARLNAKRLRQLLEAKTISQSELDTAEATLKQAEANADAVRATIAKKTIRAPFAGKLGIRQINLGQFLEAGKPIVSLQSLEPMHADFSLPQQSFNKLSKGMKVRLTTDAYPDKKFEGTLTAINPNLDEATRSIPLQATFENPDGLLRAGMFAKIEVLLPSEQNVLVIPSTSVLSAPFGDSVYLVEQKAADTNGPAGLVVHQQFIRTGATRGDFVSVESGLKPGERVASSGLFKLRNGGAVVENNELAPKANRAPKPSDS
jgi:membrane fusion protein (multidrug efflux system)